MVWEKGDAKSEKIVNFTAYMKITKIYLILTV